MRLITADLVDEARPWRHDSGKLGRVVMGLVEQGKAEQGQPSPRPLGEG